MQNRSELGCGRRLITPFIEAGSAMRMVRIYDEKGALEREIAPPVGDDMLYAPHIRSAC